MDNRTLIPHSAEAVNNLVALERKHRLFSKGERRECDICRVNKYGEPATENDILYGALDYPCLTLTQARAMVSPETLVAVTLTLRSERR